VGANHEGHGKHRTGLDGGQVPAGHEDGPAEPPRWNPVRRGRNRPLRAIITLVLALAAAAGVHLAGIPLGSSQASATSRVTTDVGHLITITGTIAFFVLALVSTFAFAHWARAVLERFVGPAYGAIIRYVMILAGIIIVVLVTLSMLGFRVAQLVVGGAVTGVLITIAAQQSLSNLFAGVMLQFARPFRVGDRVRISAGALGGTIEGTVSEFSITYVRLETGDGRVLLPNAQVLAAAVSPVRADITPDQADVPWDDPS
jgi:small-conductance mechanosensitive channel